jgi:hypothetical protein
MQSDSIGSVNGQGTAVAQVMMDLKQKIFDSLDTNGDGVVDANELADFAEKTGQKVDDIINQYDKDGDGALSASETGKMVQDAMKSQGRHRHHHVHGADSSTDASTDTNNPLTSTGSPDGASNSTTATILNIVA